MLIRGAKSRLEATTYIDKANVFLGLEFEFKKIV